MYQTLFPVNALDVFQDQGVVLIHHMSVYIQVDRINARVSLPEVVSKLGLARGYSSSESNPVKLLSLVVHNNNYIYYDRLKLTMGDEALLLKKDYQGWQ